MVWRASLKPSNDDEGYYQTVWPLIPVHQNRDHAVLKAAVRKGEVATCQNA
jgi:hypothetical protein